MLYSAARRALFLLPAEYSHHCSLDLIRRINLPGVQRLLPKPICKPVTQMNLKFRNALGLAAGLDKNAIAVEGLLALGFGFVEVGTVTPRAQQGNPKPRLFRLPEHQAIINRMGFNNAGMRAMRAQLETVRNRNKLSGGLIGVNIGKNKDTPNTDAAQDYLACMDELYHLADYLTVNLSSPNTPGLRELQGKEVLADLLKRLRDRQLSLAAKTHRHVPLLLKIAPDLSETEIAEIVQTVLQTGIEGLIASNTTLSRPVPATSIADEAGGLSGRPLYDLSLNCIERVRGELGRQCTLVGVGGVSSTDQALRMQQAGADLIQIYSAFIYQGPALVRRIAQVL